MDHQYKEQKQVKTWNNCLHDLYEPITASETFFGKKWNRQIFNLPVPMKSACSFLALPVPEQVEQALRKGLIGASLSDGFPNSTG